MTPAVTPSAPAVRTPSTSNPGVRGSSAGPSPFASMLDDALAADRPAGPGPSDRGIERRSTPDERADRTADRAADKADRIDDRASRRAERAATHAADRPDRAHTSTDATEPAVDADAVVDTEATRPGPTEESVTEPGAATDPDGARPELPATLWALAMGSPAVTAAPAQVTVTSGEVAGAAAAVPAAVPADPAPAAPSVAAAAAAVPAAAVPADAVTTTPVPAAAAPDPVATALAGFTVVRADDAPAPTPAAGLPGATPAATPTGTPTTAPAATGPSTPAAALPVEDAPVDVPAVVVPGTPAEPTTPALATAAAATAVPAAANSTEGATPSSPTTAVPAVGVAPAGEAPSSGAGSSSQQGAADGGATQAATSVLPSGTPAPTAPAVAAVAADAGATGADAAQPVSTQVARQVAVLRGGPDGAHTMTLVLTPDTLGPVEVQVTLQKGAVDLTLRGAHEQGRAALLDALPDLRRDLEAAGLSCSRLEVDRDSGGAWLDRHSSQQQAAAQQQQGFGDRGQQDRGEGRSRPWVGSADTGSSGPTPSPNRSTSSGVDYRV